MTVRATFRCGAIALAIVAVTTGRLAAAEPELLPAAPPALVQPAAKVLGSLSCASATCHGGQGARAPRREYGTWLAHDPHARAAQTLASPEFRRILAVVSSGNETGAADPHVSARCAACHDPQGLAQAGGDHASLIEAAPDLGTRGIGCESCHGPAEQWIARHYERDVDRGTLAALGMIDTKNLAVRGRACAACHVGDSEHDLNHDMLAAGHPPLRFELSAYHDLIRTKHWSDRERIEVRDYKVQLWAAGQAAAAQCMLDLLASRSRRAAAGDKQTPWPELAEYDCFACHQRLRRTNRLSIAGTQPGPGELRLASPTWQPWNLALAEPLLRSESLPALRQQLLPLVSGKPDGIATWATTAKSEISLPGHFTTRELLDFVNRQATSSDNTWAAACQELLALKAAYLAWRDAHPGSKPAWAANYGRRLAAIGRALGFGSADFEWPAFDWEGLPAPQPMVEFDSLPEISRELAALATDLAESSAADSAVKP